MGFNGNVINNSNLVGGFNHLEKYEFVNGKDDIPYMKWTNNPNVPNHQPDIYTYPQVAHMYIIICIYIYVCVCPEEIPVMMFKSYTSLGPIFSLSLSLSPSSITGIVYGRYNELVFMGFGNQQT